MDGLCRASLTASWQQHARRWNQVTIMEDGSGQDTKTILKETGKQLARGLGVGLVEEGRTWLRFAGAGAGLGAIGLGGAGFWYFGLEAGAIGAAVGAVVGGLGAWLFYLLAASEL
jgi:hypothetical protein